MEQKSATAKTFEANLAKLWEVFRDPKKVVSDKTDDTTPGWTRSQVELDKFFLASKSIKIEDTPLMSLGVAVPWGKSIAGNFYSTPLVIAEVHKLGDSHLYGYTILKKDSKGYKTSLTEPTTLGRLMEQKYGNFSLMGTDDIEEILVGNAVAFIPVSKKHKTVFAPFAKSTSPYGCMLVREGDLYETAIFVDNSWSTILPNNNYFHAMDVENASKLKKTTKSETHKGHMIITAIPVRRMIDYSKLRPGALYSPSFLGSLPSEDRTTKGIGGGDYGPKRSAGARTLDMEPPEDRTKGLEVTNVYLEDSDISAGISESVEVYPDSSRKPTIVHLYVLGVRVTNRLEKTINDLIATKAYLDMIESFPHGAS